MTRSGGRRVDGAAAAAQPRPRRERASAASPGSTIDAARGGDPDRRSDPAEPLAGARAVMLAIAAALAAGGSIWISAQPAVTHSDLDGPLTGALLRWFLYFVPTLVGVWFSASLLDRDEPPGPGPVVTTLVLAAPAVAAGTVTEILARLILGHGDVLALDGVLQRVIELVRVDVPISALVAIALTHRQAAVVPAHLPVADGRQMN